LTLGYSDQGRQLDGSHETDEVLRPRVLLEKQRVIPNFHRDLDGYDRGIQLDLSYGLASRINLVGSLPLQVWHAHDVAHGNVAQEYGTTGIGDALVGVRLAPGPHGLVTGASLKLPTGPYRVEGEFGGGIQDPTLQAGTGAWGFVGFVQESWRSNRLGVSWVLAGTYQANTSNSFDYRFGDQAIATAGMARSLGARLSVSLQTKLYHQNRNSFVGEGVPSTGGTYLYLTPGARLSLPRGFSLQGFVLFSPYSDVNEAQLAPRIGFVTGVSKLL
jgi:hypothetical protein